MLDFVTAKNLEGVELNCGCQGDEDEEQRSDTGMHADSKANERMLRNSQCSGELTCGAEERRTAELGRCFELLTLGCSCHVLKGK